MPPWILVVGPKRHPITSRIPSSLMSANCLAPSSSNPNGSAITGVANEDHDPAVACPSAMYKGLNRGSLVGVKPNQPLATRSLMPSSFRSAITGLNAWKLSTGYAKNPQQLAVGVDGSDPEG